MTPSNDPKELKRQVVQLDRQNRHLRQRVRELEREVGASLPIVRCAYEGKMVHVALVAGEQLALAADIVRMLKAAGKHPRAGRPLGADAELKWIGLGVLDLKVMSRNDMAEAFGYSSLTVGAALGISEKAGFVGFVTARGIETLERHAPGIKAWFAQAIKQLPNC